MAETAKAKILPHNLEAEQSLLGSILLENEAFDSVSDFIGPEHFFEPFHQKLFDTMRAALRAGKIVALDTIKDYLSLPGNYPICGTSLDFYLRTITAAGCTKANAGDYGREIRDLAVRRSLISLAESIAKESYSAPADASAATQIEGIEKQLYALAETNIPNAGFMPFSEVLAQTMKLAQEAYAREGKLAGVSTGFIDLDAKVGGLQRSDLVIVGGRPGMGKTAFATNVAYNVAKSWTGRINSDGVWETFTGGRVGFFSLEMSADQIGTRIISEQANIDSSKIRRGDFTEEEFARMREVEIERSSVPFFIDQSGGLNVAQVCSRARRLKRKHGLDLIVIDYLQLMAGGKNRRDNRTQELTEITSALKALAKELNVPIIALSQLSRLVEGRDDKRPQLSDLRESGSIEQDADVVIFVFREAYYIELRAPKEGTDEYIKWQVEFAEANNKADIIIAKQRHGMTGTIHMHFDRYITSFSNLVNENRMPAQYTAPMGDPSYPDPWVAM